MTLVGETPLLLLLDTCGERGSVALIRGDDVLQEVTLPERMASRAVLPAVREVLGAAEVRLRDLAGCGVVNGPGSFTGLRVGLSVAKGLAEAADLPLVAVSRLAVLAGAFGLRDGFSVLHAGPGQLYVGVIEAGLCAAEQLISVGDFLQIAQGSAVVYAEASLEPMLQAVHGSVHHVVPTAKDALRLVLAGLQGERGDPARIDANYVRDEASIYARPKGQ